MPNVGEFFADAPEHWELRGDEFLWAHLAEALANVPAPEDPRAMERLLENAFWEATGTCLSLSRQFLLEKFAEPGKTRGGISGADWRYRLFPLVMRAYAAACHPSEPVDP